MKVQLLNVLPCFMILSIVVILVETLLGWLYVAFVVDSCAARMVWLADVAPSTGTPESIVSVISILMSGVLSWQNLFRVSSPILVDGAIGKFLL